MKTVILLRSVSGAGKSTLADLLASNEGWVSVCADDYFTDINGNYNLMPPSWGRLTACVRKTSCIG